MKTLDRYIVGNFMRSALLWFMVLIALRVVADVFVSMDEFTEGDLPVTQVIGNICSYYGYQILLYVKEMGGLAIVAAAAFALARMNHTNELTAMLASGVSLYRIIWPIVMWSMLLGVVIIIDQELVIPRVAAKLVRDRDDVAEVDRMSVPIITDGTGAAWHTSDYLPTTGREVMYNVLLLVRDSDHSLLAPITGKEARPGKLDGQDGWRIDSGAMARVRKSDEPWPQIPTTDRVHSSIVLEDLITRAGIEAGGDVVAVKNLRILDEQYGMVITAGQLIPTPETPGGAVLVAPRFTFSSEAGQTLGIFAASEARWTAVDRGQGAWELQDGWLFYPTDLTAKEITLRRSSSWMQLMSAAQLTSLLRLQRVRDPERAEMTLHTHLTDPINNLIMLLLAVPFIVSRERNIKVSAGVCLLVVISFSAFVYACRYVGLPPDIAAWLPILVFGGVAAALLHGIKT